MPVEPDGAGSGANTDDDITDGAMTLTAASADPGDVVATLPRVLLVDDEPAVLAGLRRQLRHHFEIHTATSGEEGLAALETAATDPAGPFAVVVSDMRMPRMNGAAFLAQARLRWPDTTRVLLTGQAELDEAIAAVNDGQLYRFLVKPCPVETITSCIAAAVAQNRLIQAERELLERTLRGCVEALSNCLALANPVAFARATRVRDLVGALAAALQVPEPWVVEVTGVLSQLGAVVLPETVADKLHRGVQLAPAEQAMADRLPGIALQVLADIPRIDEVRDAIAWQGQRYDGNNRSGPGGDAIPLAARLLRLALDADQGLAAGLTPGHVLADLADRGGAYDPQALAALTRVPPFHQQVTAAHAVTLAQLQPGDRLDADVLTVKDTLLVGRGAEVTEQVIERLRNFDRQVPLRQPLFVLRTP